MTTQQNAYQQLLAKATQEGIRVIGSDVQDTVWLVTSHDPAVIHMVSKDLLACDCMAARYGKLCQHCVVALRASRAAARARREAQAADARRAGALVQRHDNVAPEHRLWRGRSA